MGGIISKVVVGKNGSTIDFEKMIDEEIERQRHRFRPDRLNELVAHTHFERRELKLLYRGFKEVCLNGIVTKEKIEQVLGIFFPYGDPCAYANLVFTSFDEDRNGEISFDEFVKALSVISRGTFEEKVHWIFSLYDHDRKGYVTTSDMQRIVQAMYSLMGYSTNKLTAVETRVHAEAVFEKMDKDKSQTISYEEFLHCCKKDPVVAASMELFCTVFDASSPRSSKIFEPDVYL